ncbi:hypothetical protein H0H93_008043 [Arthromyces matolae]|nr:hypothetical protein H0H93_008043 [Arthromyces matolae]
MPPPPAESMSKTLNTTSGCEGLLTLVLVGLDDKDEHYAIVPFPKTYEDAIAAAIKAFKALLNDQIQKRNIELRRSLKNRADQWIWADILPDQWEATVPIHSTEIGVFVRGPRKAEPLSFVRGPVHFVHVRDKGQGIQWHWEHFPKEFQKLPTFNHGFLQTGETEKERRLDDRVLDRPENYNVREAVQALLISH